MCDIDYIMTEKQHLMNQLEDAIRIEQLECKCEERLGFIEDGDYPAQCDILCEGCRYYDSDGVKCDIYENVRVVLEEDAEYERLGLNDYLKEEF
jgi:hypothetical protein